MRKSFDVVICGVGGQGIILVSDLLGQAGVLAGLPVRGTETHGMAQRGGSVEAHVRLGCVFGPRVPAAQADLLLALEPLEGVRYAWYLKPGATAVVNTAAIRPAGLKITYPDLKYLLEEIRKTGAHLLADDFTEQAKQLGSVKVLNVLMAGVAAPFLPVDFDTIMKALDLTVPEKFLSLNQKVLLWGRDYTRARPSGSKMAGEPRGSHG